MNEEIKSTIQCLQYQRCYQSFSFMHVSNSLFVLGELDWRAWVLTSTSVHLLILLVCYVLVKCDCWPTLHHRRIKKLSHEGRTKIKQVVEESWEELLNCAKDLIDAKLEDGENYIVPTCMTLWEK